MKTQAIFCRTAKASLLWLGLPLIACTLLLCIFPLLLRARPNSPAPQTSPKTQNALPALQKLEPKQTASAAAADKADKKEEETPLVWDRPRFDDRRKEREQMVAYQITAPGRGVEDKKVLDAMLNVPRHLFVPESQARDAYADTPLPIGWGQTISQPFIVAFMTELLKLAPGDKVLEIGTGSGYQAAVLSELTPHVYSVEIIKELGNQAAERLEKLGYKTVKVKVGDGYFGWEEHAPFDAIIVTCAAGHVPPPLLKQLKPGGRMAIPVGGAFDTQHIILVTKDREGNVTSRQVLPVMFVPMTGRIQETE
jgi:protein-L-isoaspartate(D-aspartate) O-methyltransferase